MFLSLNVQCSFNKYWRLLWILLLICRTPLHQQEPCRSPTVATSLDQQPGSICVWLLTLRHVLHPYVFDCDVGWDADLQLIKMRIYWKLFLTCSCMIFCSPSFGVLFFLEACCWFHTFSVLQFIINHRWPLISDGDFPSLTTSLTL
jgi:hypothetical protein